MATETICPVCGSKDPTVRLGRRKTRETRDGPAYARDAFFHCMDGFHAPLAATSEPMSDEPSSSPSLGGALERLTRALSTGDRHMDGTATIIYPKHSDKPGTTIASVPGLMMADLRELVEALREADQREKDAYEKGWQNGLAYGETRHRLTDEPDELCRCSHLLDDHDALTGETDPIGLVPCLLCGCEHFMHTADNEGEDRNE